MPFESLNAVSSRFPDLVAFNERIRDRVDVLASEGRSVVAALIVPPGP